MKENVKIGAAHGLMATDLFVLVKGRLGIDVMKLLLEAGLEACMDTYVT